MPLGPPATHKPRAREQSQPPGGQGPAMPVVVSLPAGRHHDRHGIGNDVRSARAACKKTTGDLQRGEHEPGHPEGRPKTHQKREEKGHEVCVAIPEQCTREKARCQRSQHPGAHARLNPAKRGGPAEYAHGNKACHDRRKPEPHSRRRGACKGRRKAHEFGHGMTRTEFEALGTGYPVIGVMGGKQILAIEHVFGILPCRVFQHPHPEGKGVNDEGEGQRACPRRKGVNADGQCAA